MIHEGITPADVEVGDYVVAKVVCRSRSDKYLLLRATVEEINGSVLRIRTKIYKNLVPVLRADIQEAWRYQA